MTSNSVVNKTKQHEEDKEFPICYKQQDIAHYKDLKQRQTAWQDSIQNSGRFWGNFAKKNVDWIAPFDTIQSGTFIKGDIGWFLNGKLNVCYNCVDRWVKYKPDSIAIIWEGNEENDWQRITFKEMQEKVCKMANVFKRFGVKKGDIIIIYMPMIPEAVYAMLACARIGAPHSVIFAGFSADAIRDRILDANAKYIICADEGYRGKKVIPLKTAIDKALNDIPNQIQTCFVFIRNTNVPCNMVLARDFNLNLEMLKERPYCPCTIMDSEDILFLLYTSGSTGKPKGIVHTNGGYLVYTMATHRYVFDVQTNDVYACVADIGWITGHSYIVYGPLANGSTTFLFESIPTYPDAGRYWSMIERHKITQFYTSPTAIRSVQKYGNDFVDKYDLSSLKVLGTVGEPINPEAWLWYFKIVGKSKCPIVDTYWQTETGGIIITPLPCSNILKPGSATLPFFGIEPALMDKETMQEIPMLSANDTPINDNSEQKSKDGMQSGILVIKRPWPGIARTVYNDHQRYLNTYMVKYPGYFYTSDGAKRDGDGYYWITGRVDDVLNVGGHRVGTAEIEAVVVQHKNIVESAVVAVPHATKGEAIFVYAICSATFDLKNKRKVGQLQLEIRNLIRNKLSPIFTPDFIMLVNAVPKTRSGKIMRRILRKIASEEYGNLGDISTLADSTVVEGLIQVRKKLK